MFKRKPNTNVQGSEKRKPGIKVPHHCAKFLGIRHKGAKCPQVFHANHEVLIPGGNEHMTTPMTTLKAFLATLDDTQDL